MSIESEIQAIEKQIAALKRKRDNLIKNSNVGRDRLQRILSMRSPQRTICQLLRELHGVLEGDNQEKIAQCLLIAKKMNDKLVEYAGKHYAKNWYDKNGNFK